MRGIRCAAAAVGVGILLAVLAAVPAHSAGSAYVALGDSYSSGTGTRSYLSDGTSCQRSVFAYRRSSPAAGIRPELPGLFGGNHRRRDQPATERPGGGTMYASITVGGNDAGFATVLTECAKPAWASNCNAAIDRAQSTIIDQDSGTSGNLVRLDPQPRAAGPRGGGRLPASVQR